MRHHRMTAVLAALPMLAAATLTAAGAGTAQAVQDTLSCIGRQTVTVDPPLTNAEEEHDLIIDGELTSCVHAGGTPGIKSGTYHEEVQDVVLSCQSLLDDASNRTRTFNWTTTSNTSEDHSSSDHKKQTSVFTYDQVQTRLNANAVITQAGTITSGRFSGQPAKEVITIPRTELDPCSGDGVSQADGAVTFNVSP